MRPHVPSHLRQAQNRLAQWPAAAFCLALAVGNFVMVLLFAIPLALSIGPISPNRFAPFQAAWDADWWWFFLDSAIIAPLVETLLIQVLFIELARYWRLDRHWQYALSVISFLLPHALRAFPYGVISGICMGFSLAYCYLHWRERSRRHAFWTTAGTHALYNTLVTALLTASIAIG